MKTDADYICNLKEIVGIIENCVNRCETNIPYYAYGDNQAACEMACRLNEIQDELCGVLTLIDYEKGEEKKCMTQ